MSDQAKRVLVIEDEKAYSRALVLKLQNAGYEVKSADNGQAALELLKEDSFDLVTTDLIMPQLDGFALLDELKKIGKKIPTIVLSNLSQEDDKKRVLDMGADVFLEKSNVSISDVLEKIEELLS